MNAVKRDDGTPLVPRSLVGIQQVRMSPARFRIIVSLGALIVLLLGALTLCPFISDDEAVGLIPSEQATLTKAFPDLYL